MHFTHLKQIEKRKKADLLVLPFWKNKQEAQAAISLDKEMLNSIKPVLSTQDFKAKEGEVLYLYIEGHPEKRIALLGLGEIQTLTSEKLRISYSNLTKSCLSKKIKSINLALPQHEKIDKKSLKAIVEGLLLSNDVLNQPKKEEPHVPLESIHWIGNQKEILEIAKQVSIICQAVYQTRFLVNGNADEVTPQYLAQYAKQLADQHSKIHTIVFDKKRIEKEKMGLLLAVNRGSSSDPAFIILEYKGLPKDKDHTILIGKGVTYDTGGLNLKPTGSMETMKCDMAGAAACLGTIQAVAELQLPVNLTVLIPTTENSIDANSFKPGDVYTSYSGKTVEMTNSDAEGRLILADALAYGVKNLKPTRIIDIATLTGAIEIALGSEASGLMSTDDQLSQSLMTAGEETFERVWRMPLYEEYQEKLKSDIADFKSWNGRSASSSVAAMFLRQFVEKCPWAHLDIAGTAYLTDSKKYHPKYATGIGVRLLVEFLAQLSLR